MKDKIKVKLEILNYLFWKYPILFIITGFIFLLLGLLIGNKLWPSLIPCKPETPKVSIDIKSVEAMTASRPFCADVIKCIRDVGEELKQDNQVIMTMIRIARAESNFKEKAKNPNSTASGVFQITLPTWKSNKCNGDMFNAEDNIRCAYSIYSRRGYQPWQVCATGKAKCYK